MPFTVEEIAKEFDCHVKYAYRLTKAPDFPLPYKRENRKTYWLAGEVREWKRNKPDGRGRWPRR